MRGHLAFAVLIWEKADMHMHMYSCPPTHQSAYYELIRTSLHVHDPFHLISAQLACSFVPSFLPSRRNASANDQQLGLEHHYFTLD